MGHGRIKIKTTKYTASNVGKKQTSKGIRGYKMAKNTKSTRMVKVRWAGMTWGYEIDKPKKSKRQKKASNGK